MGGDETICRDSSINSPVGLHIEHILNVCVKQSHRVSELTAGSAHDRCIKLLKKEETKLFNQLRRVKTLVII